MDALKFIRSLFWLGSILAMMLFVSCKNDIDSVQFVEEPTYVFSDIELFWKVYDSNNHSSNNFQSAYINQGSVGLKDYSQQKNLATALSQRLTNDEYVNYYNAIRANTIGYSSVISKSNEAFNLLKNYYNNSRFVDVFFVIGAGTAGGRVSKNGLLIAVELFSSDESIDISNLSEWHQNVIRNKEYLASIVVHELIHIQQFGLSSNGSVLEVSIKEGIADFISHILLLDEPFMNEHLHTYGDPVEAEIWAEFQSEMNRNHSTTEWLYTGKKTSKGHPADMGYYVGYKIVESFYLNYNSKKEAITAILTSNYRTIFEESGYADKFN